MRGFYSTSNSVTVPAIAQHLIQQLDPEGMGSNLNDLAFVQTQIVDEGVVWTRPNIGELKAMLSEKEVEVKHTTKDCAVGKANIMALMFGKDAAHQHQVWKLNLEIGYRIIELSNRAALKHGPGYYNTEEEVAKSKKYLYMAKKWKSIHDKLSNMYLR